MWSYYLRWLRLSLIGAFGPADTVAGIGLAFIAAIPHVWPSSREFLEARMGELAWQVPILVLATFAMFRLFLAPHLMFREQQEGIERLRSVEENNTKRRTVREKLAGYLEEGRQLINLVYEESRNQQEPTSNSKAEKWAGRVEEFFRGETMLGNEYIPRFRSFAGLPAPHLTTLLPPHAQIEFFLRTRMARLYEFIKELR